MYVSLCLTLTTLITLLYVCYFPGLYADRIPITMCGTLEFMSPEVMPILIFLCQFFVDSSIYL